MITTFIFINLYYYIYMSCSVKMVIKHREFENETKSEINLTKQVQDHKDSKFRIDNPVFSVFCSSIKVPLLLIIGINTPQLKNIGSDLVFHVSVMISYIPFAAKSK